MEFMTIIEGDFLLLFYYKTFFKLSLDELVTYKILNW